jgi:hypothetical protein
LWKKLIEVRVVVKVGVVVLVVDIGMVIVVVNVKEW